MKQDHYSIHCDSTYPQMANIETGVIYLPHQQPALGKESSKRPQKETSWTGQGWRPIGSWDWGTPSNFQLNIPSYPSYIQWKGEGGRKTRPGFFLSTSRWCTSQLSTSVLYMCVLFILLMIMVLWNHKLRFHGRSRCSKHTMRTARFPTCGINSGNHSTHWQGRASTTVGVTYRVGRRGTVDTVVWPGRLPTRSSNVFWAGRYRRCSRE